MFAKHRIGGRLAAVPFWMAGTNRRPCSPSPPTSFCPAPSPARGRARDWFDVSMWGRPLDTCMMDVRFREKFQDALAHGDQRRGARRARHPHPRRPALRRRHGRPLVAPLPACSAGRASRATTSSPRRPARPGCAIPPGTLLNEIYTGWRWPRVVDKIEHRPLDYAEDLAHRPGARPASRSGSAPAARR